MILYFSGEDTLGTALLVLPRDTRSHGTGRFGIGIGIGAAYGTAGVGTALLKMQVFGGLRGARGLASRHQGYYLARYLILTWSCGGLIHHLP